MQEHRLKAVASAAQRRRTPRIKRVALLKCITNGNLQIFLRSIQRIVYAHVSIDRLGEVFANNRLFGAGIGRVIENSNPFWKYPRK